MTSVDQIVEYLRQHPGSWSVDDDGLDRIAAVSTCQHLRPGQVVHPLGQPVRDVAFVISGRLKMTIKVPNAQDLAIQYLPTGTQFGLLAISQEITMPVEVVADVESIVVSIPRVDLKRLADELPLWRRNLLKLFGGNLNGTLRTESNPQRPRVIVCWHASDDTRRVSTELISQLHRAGVKVTVFSDRAPNSRLTQSGIAHRMIDARAGGTVRDHAHQIASQQDCSELVIVDIGIDLDASSTRDLLHAADHVYWMTRPPDKVVTETFASEFAKDVREGRQNARWVWCLAKDEPVAPIGHSLSVVQRTLKVHTPDGDHAQNRASVQGVARLLHDVRNTRVGIALGGGAARGMAHLGVLEAFDEAGIVFDSISGTSAGAMVGIVYAAGLPPAEAARCFARDLTPSPLERKLPGGQGVYLMRKYRSGQWTPMLQPYLHDWHLEQLPIPVSSVAVDLVSASQIVTSNGDAISAVLESINLPGISPPICRDGMALVDGGILNVVPADVLIRQGCDLVISVDVGSHLSHEFVGNASDTSTAEMRVPGAFQTMMRVMQVTQTNMRDVGAQAADITIAPDVSSVDATDFQHAVETAQLGKRAAMEMLPDIKERLLRLDPCFVT